jgi:UDP-N-acetylmuramate--alanine ligase
VLVTEVYPSREPVDPSFSGSQIVEAMDHPDARFVARMGDVVDYLSSNLGNGDVLIVLSAGDADQLCIRVLEKLVIQNEVSHDNN